MINRIKHWLCKHDFNVTKFQALLPGTGWQCTKCGKQHRTY